MSPSTLLRRAAGVAILSSIITATGFSQSATTDPVGFVTVNYAGSSDSYSYIPFKRTPEYAGAVVTPSGVTGSAISVAGTPNFTANQFVYVAGTQPKKYYVLFTAGAKIGMYYTITANSTNSLTVDTAGDDISGVSGATFQVIPYDTLGSIFPGGQGIVASTGHGLAVRQTEVQLPSSSTAGTDLAAATIYYYFNGTGQGGPGWRSTATGPTVILNDDILYPDTNFIVRQKTATASQTTFMGTVHMGTLSTPIGTITAGVNQDNAISLPIAADLTAAQSKLFESGAFVGSTGHGLGVRQDELYVRDNSIVGYDKGASKIYYYYTGTANNGPGWRRTDDSPNNIHNSDVIISETLGLTIRKKSTGAPTSVVWSVKPPYVP